MPIISGRLLNLFSELHMFKEIYLQLKGGWLKEQDALGVS